MGVRRVPSFFLSSGPQFGRMVRNEVRSEYLTPDSRITASHGVHVDHERHIQRVRFVSSHSHPRFSGQKRSTLYDGKTGTKDRLALGIIERCGVTICALQLFPLLFSEISCIS